MATTTERFGFTLPAGSDPVLRAHINGNTNLTEKYLGATQDMIAPMYNDTDTYEVGDICTYDSVLYKCITAITTAEPFDATKWTETTAVEEGSGGGGGSNVIPNPTGTPTDTLSTVSIDGTIYGIEGSGGGGSQELISYDTTITTTQHGWWTAEDKDGNVLDPDQYELIAVTPIVNNSPSWVGSWDGAFFITNYDSIAYHYYVTFVNINDGGYIRSSRTWDVKVVYRDKNAAGGGGGGSSKAEDINYDNTTSHLSADNVQKAIDEVVANANTASEDILTLQNVQGYDKYDETQTYAVGDYAIYNNIVYECTTAVTTAEPFDSTKWTATSIEQIIDGVKGDISQLNSSLNNKSNQLLVAAVVSGSKSVNANSTAYIDTTITRSGYTALGIVGLSGSGTGNFAFQDNSLVSSNTVARVYVRNLTNATATINSLNIYILYVKN